MNRYPILQAIVAATIVATLGACGAAFHLSGTNAMTQSATQTQPDTTTYCLGRFVIGVPTGSRISGGSYKYDFERIEKPVAMGFEEFVQETKVLEEKRRATIHEKDPSLLRAIQRPDSSSVVMAYWEDPSSAGIVNVDGYKWIDGIRILIRDGAGLGLLKDGSGTKQDLAITDMRDSLSRLRLRADTDIPKEPGYCFEGGFIANEKWKNEQALATIDIAGHPDAFVTVWILPVAAHKRDKPLLDRMVGALQQLGSFASGVQVLRQGDRQIDPYKGQEYLAAGPNSGGLRGHMFSWETQGEGTLDTPSIEIKLETGHQDDKGNPQQTRLTDEQALQLWDRIVGSFRLRPVDAAGVKTSQAPAPDAPLGELAATGRPCPQTGWWTCAAESLPIQGGRRHFIRAGEPMPHVVLLGEGNFWQKLKGDRPTYPVTSVWELVDYGPPASSLSATAETGSGKGSNDAAPAVKG
jgi:hypothetical protein